MTALVYVSAALLGYAAIEQRLSRSFITGPMIFVALGLIASNEALGIIDAGEVEVTSVVDVLFQAALVLMLFTNAAALRFSSWRQDAALPGRLLGISLPLTIALGTLLVAGLVSELTFWEAAVVAAIIAPTDAALGEAVISNPLVPERIREALDIESGLNDGISLPFVLIFIGLAEGSGWTGPGGTFVDEIGIAAGVGIVVGAAGGLLVKRASKANWMSLTWANIAVVAIAVLTFVIADELGGSGFIAAFVGGLGYGRVMGTGGEASNVLSSDIGEGLVQVSFLVFGAVVLAPELGSLTWQIVAVGVLALTVMRMVPVALAMLGTGQDYWTQLYLGWFGPRGLATIVFAALVVTDSDLQGESTITAIAAFTVALSVAAHGITSYIGSQRYAAWAQGES